MAITLTPRFGEPQWSAGADSPSRTLFNNAFLSLDQKAAYDDGAAATGTLPVSNVVDGRYAATLTESVHRRLFRRAGGAWIQVGGNSWSETVYGRAAVGAAQSAVTREVSHPDLTAPTVVERWDGTSIRGGRQAIGDINPTVPSALHIGDTAAVVDLAARGRVYVRTTATGHKGVVASAHAADAGALFTARDAGGGDPWTVDAQGRMRSQVPSAFGAGALTTGVPIAVAPSTSDVAGVDLYAATGKPALRLFRTMGDSAAIGLIEQDKITLGRPTWTGGVVELRAPSVNVFGAFDVSGSTVLDSLTVGTTLGVTGTATLEAVNAGVVAATSVDASGALEGGTVNAVGALTAQGGLVSSAVNGSGAELRTRPPTQVSGTAQQSVRAPVCYRKTVEATLDFYAPYIANGNNSYDVTVTMPEDGYMRLDAELWAFADLGNSNGYEPFKFFYEFELRNSTGSSLLSAAPENYAMTILSDDSSRQIQGRSTAHQVEVYPVRLTAGTHTIRFIWSLGSPLAGVINRLRYTVTPVVLHTNITA